MASKILLLEDDELFNATISDFLEEEGFEVVSVYDPIKALELTFKENFDLYLIDINLPFESGLVFLEKLRKSDDVTPSIFLTSREDKESLHKGFLIGADDYIKKPVDLDELLLRINAILKRVCRKETIFIDGYTLDIISKTLKDKNGELLNLNTKAIELLILLIENKNEVVSNEVIKDRLYPAGVNASSGAIRVYITQLKKIFKDKIVNIRSVGYSFKE
jgi:DNA-binding response OmpR family regulator